MRRRIYVDRDIIVGDRLEFVRAINTDEYVYPKWLLKANYIEVTSIDGAGQFAINDFTLDAEELVNFRIVEYIYKED